MMTPIYNVNDVVQFTKKHKWAGNLGIVIEAKATENDFSYLIMIPSPEKKTAFITVNETEDAIEWIGIASFIPSEK